MCSQLGQADARPDAPDEILVGVVVAGANGGDNAAEQLFRSFELDVRVCQFLDVPLIGDLPALVRSRIVGTWAPPSDARFARNATGAMQGRSVFEVCHKEACSRNSLVSSAACTLRRQWISFEIAAQRGGSWDLHPPRPLQAGVAAVPTRET